MGLYHLDDERQAAVHKIRKRVIENIGRNMDLYAFQSQRGIYTGCFILRINR